MCATNILVLMNIENISYKVTVNNSSHKTIKPEFKINDQTQFFYSRNKIITHNVFVIPVLIPTTGILD